MSGTKHKAPQVRRFIEQRWLLDNVIAANGIDWDQPRTAYLGAPLGLEAQSDFAAIRLRVKKFADCSPAFQAQGRRREGRAKEALEAGNTVTARENYLMAAVHWGAAQWPFDENNEENLLCNTRKRECYSAYAKIAAHKIEEAWIPFKGAKLPAWLPSGVLPNTCRPWPRRWPPLPSRCSRIRTPFRPTSSSGHSGLHRELGGDGSSDHGLGLKAQRDRCRSCRGFGQQLRFVFLDDHGGE